MTGPISSSQWGHRNTARPPGQGGHAAGEQARAATGPVSVLASEAVQCCGPGPCPASSPNCRPVGEQGPPPQGQNPLQPSPQRGAALLTPPPPPTQAWPSRDMGVAGPHPFLHGGLEPPERLPAHRPALCSPLLNWRGDPVAALTQIQGTQRFPNPHFQAGDLVGREGADPGCTVRAAEDTCRSAETRGRWGGPGPDPSPGPCLLDDLQR